MAKKKAPRLTGKALLAALTRAGFVIVNIEGSHYQLRRILNGQRVGSLTTVPVHGSEIVPQGTLRAVLRQGGMTLDDLRALL